MLQWSDAGTIPAPVWGMPRRFKCVHIFLYKHTTTLAFTVVAFREISSTALTDDEVLLLPIEIQVILCGL